MKNLLAYRDAIIEIFTRYERIFMFIFKFIVGLIIYTNIVDSTNSAKVFASLIAGSTGVIYIVLLAFAFAVLPYTISYLFMVINIIISLSGFPIIAALVALVLFCVVVFYTRLAPRESLLIIATVISFHFKIPFLVPIIAGLYFSIVSFVPIVIGTFLWALSLSVHNILSQATGITSTTSINDVMASIVTTNQGLVNFCFHNTDFVYYSFVFIGVTAFVYFVSHADIEHNREFAVAIGCVINLVGVLFIRLIVDSNFGLFSAILFIIISALLAVIIMYFDIILDYNSIEKVFFQDDENLYYVKIIPKFKGGTIDNK